MHCAKRMSGSETVMHLSHSHSFVLRNACREPVPRVITFLYDTLEKLGKYFLDHPILYVYWYFNWYRTKLVRLCRQKFEAAASLEFLGISPGFILNKRLVCYLSLYLTRSIRVSLSHNIKLIQASPSHVAPSRERYEYPWMCQKHLFCIVIITSKSN